MQEIIPGKIISHYKIIEKLGAGGMGVVYKAEDLNLERTAALKFLPPELSRDEEAKQRFFHEAKAASALDHQNICNVYEIGETESEQLFIAMAYYEGETLKSKIGKGALSKDEAVRILLQLTEGLKQAHKKEIIHRDLKPANIFVTNEGIVKILDFGLAKASGRTQLTQMGSTVGTCNYMSPEQARGGEVDQRTDIWSLGIVMYEMLTGKPPFSADYEQAIIYSILNENPNLSNISTELLPVIKKMIAKNPSERFRNTEEIITELKSLLNVPDDKNQSNKLYQIFTNHRPRTKLMLVPIIVIALVLLILNYFLGPGGGENETASLNKIKMIVVLPFENLGSPDDDYFAEGVRNEISNKLSTLASIGVISRNSAEKYAKSNKTTKEIGRELGVDYILEGTIQWAKNKNQESRVRIVPQLVRVSDDVSVWSDSFDKIIKDIFNIQNEIAENVVNNLGIKLLPNQSVSGPPPTTNLEAYDYYLKAYKFHYGPSTGANIKTAVKLYEQALKLDPNFAAAHAQLSVAYNGLFKWRWDRDSLNLKKAEYHLKRAIEINPGIPEIHLARFFYLYWFTKNEERAINELEKVLEQQPNNAEALFFLSGFYRDQGKFYLTKEYEQKCLKLDPLNARYPWGISREYQLVKDYPKAEYYIKKAINISPNMSSNYIDLAFIYLAWKADTKLARVVLKNVNDEEYLEFYPNVFVYLDLLDRNFDDALKKLKRLREYENTPSDYTPNNLMIAFIYKYIGEDSLAKKYFATSQKQLERMLLTNPKDFRLYFALAKCYAGLNELNKALNKINEGLKIDSTISGNRKKIIFSSNMIFAYILTGDYKNALKQIDILLSVPSFFSVNILKLDPIYDPLRNLEGYKGLIAKYSSNFD